MTDIASLAREVAALEHEIATLEDLQAIRALQFKYGYYLDKCLMEEVVDLYAPDCELHFMGSIWRGKAGARRLYVDTIGKLFTGGVNGPVDGLLSDYLQLQDIVDVARDRKTARGRFRYFMQGATHHSRPTVPTMPPQWFEAGTYENIYVKQDGVWKIGRLNLHLSFRCDYQTGWRYALAGATGGRPKLFPENPTGPDDWRPGYSDTWPNAHAQPFHYSHPVTGKTWSFGSKAAPTTDERGPSNAELDEAELASRGAAGLAAKLAELEDRAGILADMDAIRRVQFTYGYLMDKFLFNEVVDLFTADGELRHDGNVYRGHDALRRVYVDLIGAMYTKGKNRPVDGVLADHTQMQDVITVAPDRLSANGRFRYFMQGATHISIGESLMPQGSLWEAGVYENRFVKEGGVWKIKVLGLHGSYRVDYQAGWRYGTPFARTVPVCYPENPRGPTEYHDGYYPAWPKAHLVPFHYAHPVTGKAWGGKPWGRK